MTDPATARSFLVSEVEALESFGYVAVVPGGRPLHIAEVTRREDGTLEVRVLVQETVRGGLGGLPPVA